MYIVFDVHKNQHPYYVVILNLIYKMYSTTLFYVIEI